MNYKIDISNGGKMMQSGSEEIKDNGVPLTKAIGIIVIVIAAVVGVGLFIGNKFFWNQFPQTTVEDVEMQKAKQLVVAKPKSAIAHVNLAYSYLLKEDRKHAEPEYLKAYSINKKDTIVLLNIGIAYAHWKEYDKAIGYFNELIKLAPLNFDGHFNLGSAYYAKANYSKAIEEYKTAIKIDHGAADVYYGLGQAYYKTGDKKAALEAVNQALKFVPDYKEAKELKAAIAK